MAPLVLIASFLLVVNHHVTSVTGYELLCEPQFLSIIPAQGCTLTNATQYDLDTFGVAGIPEGALLKIINPEFHKFDELGFKVLQNALSIMFSGGIVKSIEFQSSTLVSLKVMNSWIIHFEVAEEDNFSLKMLSIKSDKYRIISPTLRYLKGLEELTFQKCGLEFIDFTVLSKLKKLRKLNLSWNKIHFVTIDPSMPLVALKSLDVSHNQLKDMQNFPDAFPSLKAATLVRNAWYCDWVSEARGNIWTAGITVLGAETFCFDPRNEQMTNNGGLCCKERPVHHHSIVHGIVHEILGALYAPKKNSTQPNIVLLEDEDNSGKPSVLVYSSN